MTEVLKVLLWGQEIGRLAWHDARKTSFFMYNPEFLKTFGCFHPQSAQYPCHLR